MINCFVITEKCNLNDIATCIAKYPLTRLVGQYEGNSLKYAEIMELSVHILFIDYNFRSEFKQLLTKLAPYVSIVYLAEGTRYAYQAFEDGVLDYIVYPYDFMRFERSINKFVRFSILASSDHQNERYFPKVNSFFIKPDPKNKIEVLINSDDVLFIEAFQNDVAIQMADGRRFISFHTMKEMEQNLSNLFMRVHKSFIINYKKISAFDGSHIIIESGRQFRIPLGGVYKKSFLDKRSTMLLKKPGRQALKNTLRCILPFIIENLLVLDGF